MKRRILGLRQNAFFLGLASLLNDLSGEMVYSVMPAFLTSVLGAPAFFLGLIEGVADALASVLKIFSGRLSDSLKRRKVFVVIGYTLSDFTRLFLTFTTHFWQVFSIRLTDRVGKGLRDAPRDALLAESVDANEVGRSFGYQRAMDAFGSMLGPALGIFLLSSFAGSYRELFYVGFFIGLLALFMFMFVHEPRRRGVPSYILPRSPQVSFGSFGRPFRSYLGAIFVFSMGALPLPLMLLTAPGIGLGLSAIPLMYLVYNTAFVIFAVPFGRLADRVGEKWIIAGGFFAALLSYAIFLTPSGVWGIVLGFIFFGLYAAMTNGVCRAFTAKLVRREELAAGEGFLSAASGIASLVSGVVGGILWTIFGSGAAFFYGIIFMALGFFWLVRISFRLNHERG